MEKIFWLHIKKSAGTATRKALGSIYTEDNRRDCPQCFIMADKKYYNDILNNFSTPLGIYQFKRMLFAKKFLYSPYEFKSLYKFCFAREPINRVKSMFFYLFADHIQNIHKENLNSQLPNLFNVFLDCVHETRLSESNTKPYGLHFQTHTAEMYSDIADENGEILMDKIWKLDNLTDAFKEISQITGITSLTGVETLNTSKRLELSLDDNHLEKIYKLYGRDFEIYNEAS